MLPLLLTNICLLIKKSDVNGRSFLNEAIEKIFIKLKENISFKQIESEFIFG